MLLNGSVSAIIPTRGDVDLRPITERLRQYAEVDDIWYVASGTPFNRYRGVPAARHDVIYTQDDDCLTDLRPLLDAWPGRRPRSIVNAMTPAHSLAYQGAQTLIGFGCLFDRSAVNVFVGMEEKAKRENWLPLLLRESDRVFATLNPHTTVFPRIENLPWAEAANRFYRQPEHGPSHVAIMERIGVPVG